MKTYYHGTTRSLAESILNNETKPQATWCCSDDDNLYLWSPDAMLDDGECDTMEYSIEYAIRNAFESAQITAAMSALPVDELVVLRFDFPDDFEDLTPDDSCENMTYAVQVDMKMISDIKKYYVESYSCNHNSRLDVFVVSAVLDNQYINEIAICDDMLEACEQIKGMYLESMHEFEWSNCTLLPCELSR